MTRPKTFKRKTFSGKEVEVHLVLAQSYGDVQERLRAEEAEWESKCGPVIIRKVEDRT